MTNLQTALQEANLNGLAFYNDKGNIDETVAVSDLPDATLIKLLTYGKRYFNDRVNGYTGKGTKEEYARTLLDALKEGVNVKLTSTASPFDAEMLVQVTAQWIKQGLTKKAATKAAKQDGTIIKLVCLAAANKLNRPVDDINMEDYVDHAEAFTKQLKQRVQNTVQARCEVITLDFD